MSPATKPCDGFILGFLEAEASFGSDWDPSLDIGLLQASQDPIDSLLGRVVDHLFEARYALDEVVGLCKHGLSDLTEDQAEQFRKRLPFNIEILGNRNP